MSKPKFTHWVTRDRQRMLLTEMADSHLQNAVDMIERGKKWRRWQLVYLKAEQLRRAQLVKSPAPSNTVAVHTGRMFKEEA